ncbi:MAG: hypothetical protein ACW976_00440, partial [Candidatus Ranarchaeia archaeon]
MTVSNPNDITCPQCNGNPVTHKGYYVCSNCGLELMPAYVQQQYVINRSSGKTFYGRSFVYLGDRPNIVDGLGSYIDHPQSNYFHDTHGKTLKADNQSQFSRLKNRYSLETRIMKRETD